ncbi:hypothetical protein M6B38_279860 [Iris pallida]|uniref:Uncharacterized protein n=1 Tax=Iris pallida TaxID=29817 RepID=A0AAX6HYB7_IRIPA|nr:hypothetical protein M6B38_279860 [Iris pallida]
MDPVAMWRRRPDPGSMKSRRGGVGGDVEEDDDSSVPERSAQTSKRQPDFQGGVKVTHLDRCSVQQSRSAPRPERRWI